MRSKGMREWVLDTLVPPRRRWNWWNIALGAWLGSWHTALVLRIGTKLPPTEVTWASVYALALLMLPTAWLAYRAGRFRR